jgi:hypothetical protein
MLSKPCEVYFNQNESAMLSTILPLKSLAVSTGLGGKKLWLLAALLSLAPQLFGQVTANAKVQDPLSKPQIWKTLLERPEDDALWSSYLGEDLFSLDKARYQQYTAWKAQLIEEKKLEEEKKELELVKKRQEYMEKRSGRNYSERDYQELLQNVFKNFSIIEQYFADQFKLHGQQYTWYQQVHPDEKYSKTKWVEEQEQKLTILRKKP